MPSDAVSEIVTLLTTNLLPRGPRPQHARERARSSREYALKRSYPSLSVRSRARTAARTALWLSAMLWHLARARGGADTPASYLPLPPRAPRRSRGPRGATGHTSDVERGVRAFERFSCSLTRGLALIFLQSRARAESQTSLLRGRLLETRPCRGHLTRCSGTFCPPSRPSLFFQPFFRVRQ